MVAIRPQHYTEDVRSPPKPAAEWPSTPPSYRRVAGECLPSHSLPPVPAEQRHAIFRLRCKYSVQVRKASRLPVGGGEAGVGMFPLHKRVKVHQRPAHEFALLGNASLFKFYCNLFAIVVSAEFAMSTLIFQCWPGRVFLLRKLVQLFLGFQFGAVEFRHVFEWVLRLLQLRSNSLQTSFSNYHCNDNEMSNWQWRLC